VPYLEALPVTVDEVRSETPTEAPAATDVTLAYAGPSRVAAVEGSAALALFGNLRRDPVRLEGRIRQPLRCREALSALHAIVGSDYRYVPKDRTAYLAYLRHKKEATGLSHWQAQQAYFSWLLRNDPLAYCILDPLITVHPDAVFFEVFSRDESTYARLEFASGAFDLAEPPTCGTTNIDFSPALFDSIQQMRSYRETKLSIGRELVRFTTADAGEVLEKRIRVPDSWLRGFLQVQSAMMLPRASFTLAPMDLYNVLRHLRLHADRKGQRRGLRVELVPGEQPRLVLEPWEEVFPTRAAVYRGPVARIVRVWGRRRLLLLRRLLPFVERVDVHLLGSGLPSFWVLRAGDMTITLALTGFTAANWSQAVSFDLLLPRKTQGGAPLETIIGALGDRWFAGTAELAAATGLKDAALVEALQLGCQQGRLMYDLAADVYRLRPVLDEPADLPRLQYRNRTERSAHDLLVRRGAVAIVSENRIAGAGLELTGKVTVAEDRREYRPLLLLADEGQVSKADCTCPPFRKQGLKAGPCVHLVALRLAHAAEETTRRTSTDPRQTVTVETRSFSQRDASGEAVVQVSLQRQRLVVRWGRAGADLRRQVLKFNTVEDARAAYFARVDELTADGFVDASAG